MHGGLTFADSCQETEDESRGICHVPEKGQPDNVWWFGFDCAHSGDVCPKYDLSHSGYETYKNIAYVKLECENLARQLSAA